MAFTLDNLKTGHIVQFRNGDYYIVFTGSNIFNSGFALMPLGGGTQWSALGGVNKNLQSNISDDLDIVRVYEINSPYSFPAIEKFNIMKKILSASNKEKLEKLLTHRTIMLLYEENSTKKLTVSEISELLGYPVKIVREHESED